MANNSKYLDYQGLQRLVENINKKYAPIQAIVFKSTVDDIASLPALNTVKAGFMYNIKTGGLTTDDFVEGAGHIVADGENIAAVELLTGTYDPVAAPAATDDPKALGWYEVDTTSTFFAPEAPVSDPATEGFYEFTAVTPAGGEDPSALGWYEEDGVNYILSADASVDGTKNYATGAPSTDPSVAVGKTYYKQKTVTTYKLSQDRLPVSGKSYFTAETVMKWDLMGGVFDLEDRYLEFGDTFPQTPPSKMVEGRTFLYMGETTKVYTKVNTPEGRPSENGYFEVDSATPVADPASIFNPRQQQLYEEDATDPSAVFYVLSADITPDALKTYYEVNFVASADTSVDPAKIYYTEAEQYRKGGIYKYNATDKDWELQSSGGSDMTPITNKEIDDLFI